MMSTNPEGPSPIVGSVMESIWGAWRGWSGIAKRERLFRERSFSEVHAGCEVSFVMDSAGEVEWSFVKPDGYAVRGWL